jgi:hypothetical protein
MSIRLDPRRLGSLKQLAGEAGLRPGELVLRWVEERIDAERRGGPTAGAVDVGGGALTARLDELADRIAALEAAAQADQPAPAAAQSEPTEAAGSAVPEAVGQPRRRGRPRKAAAPRAAAGPRVALHDEIIAVISERGPSSAADIAAAIADRGRYAPPRSAKGLNAATVNSRVSNPAYRERFRRQDGRIGLAESD